MEARGIRFDNSIEDKQEFDQKQKEIGSERAFLYKSKEYDENSVVLSKEDVLKIESELARWAVAIYGVEITA